jgi:hypothetical protein
VRGSPLRSGGLTVVNQIIEDMFGDPIRIVLASLRKGDDLRGDDFSHRGVHVSLKHERIADLLKGRP